MNLLIHRCLIKTLIPKFIRKWSKNNPTLYIWTIQSSLFRIITSRFRVVPSLFIIGEMKCGTTSLHEYLKQNSFTHASSKKELYFFSNNPSFKVGFSWYRSFFPLKITLKLFDFLHKQKSCVYESSTDYLYSSICPQRIKDNIKDPKFIVCLRNPIERTFSHYKHCVKTGFENKKTFEDALDAEKDRLKKFREEGLEHNRWSAWSYVERSMYYDSINRWFKIFSKDNFLFIDSYELDHNPIAVMRKIEDFIEIPHYDHYITDKHMVGNKSKKIDPITRERLKKIFSESNERLVNLINTKFDWD